MMSCKVYQIDASTLSQADRDKLIQQRANTHVRIQQGWVRNPYYWDQYYNNWYGWQHYNRYRPTIIIKPKRRKPNGNNTRNVNPVRGNRGSNNTINRPKGRQVVKPTLPSRLRRENKRNKKQ